MILIDYLKETGIPEILQQVRQIAWVKVQITPLQRLMDKLISYENDRIAGLIYNAQVIYFEKILNDKFDNLGRRIYIEDEQRENRIMDAWDYSTVQNQPNYPSYLGFRLGSFVGKYPSFVITDLLYSYDEFTEGIDYKIFVPQGIIDVLGIEPIDAIVKRYNIAGKIYKIYGF